MVRGKFTVYIMQIIFLVLLSQTVCAGVVYEEEVKDNIPFYIDGVKHIPRYYPSAEKLSLGVGEERLLIQKGDCETLEGVQYCVDDATAGIEEETGDPMSTVKLRVVEFGPEIKISRSISDETPLVDSEVTIVATITNQGTERATSITYTDKYPTEVKMNGAPINRAFNQAEWTGSLDPGNSEQLTYTLKFTDFIEHTSVAKVKYLHKGKVTTVESGEEKFTVQKPYSFNTSLSSESVAKGEEIKYYVTVENDAAEVFETKITIDLPTDILVTRRDAQVKGVDPLTIENEIAPGASETYEFSFKSNKKGEYTLKTDLDLSSTSYKFKDSVENEVAIGVSAIVAQVNISPSEVMAGGEYMAEVKIYNRGKETITVDAVDFESDIADKRGWRAVVVEPGKNFYALNKILYAPITYETEEHYYRISGSYRSTTGTFEFDEKNTFTILPFEKVVELTADHFLENESDGHKYVNVTLRIENIKEYKLTEINVIDSLPKGAKLVAGQRDYEAEELKSGEEVTAYSYVVRLPKDFTGDSFEVVHTFNAMDPDGEKVIFEMPVDIDMGKTEPDAEFIEETPEIEEQAENESEELIEEEKEEIENPGVFKRMWNWFKGLFGGDDDAESEAEEDEEIASEPQENESEQVEVEEE